MAGLRACTRSSSHSWLSSVRTLRRSVRRLRQQPPEPSVISSDFEGTFWALPHSEDAAGMSRLGAVSGPKRVLGSSKSFCSEEELDMSTLSVVSNLPTLQSERGLSRYLAAVRKFPLLSA